MHADVRELTIDPTVASGPTKLNRYGPATEIELKRMAEQVHGGPLGWYKAYRGNLYAQDDGLTYAIRRIPPQAD